MATLIKTRFLILSDTHGEDLKLPHLSPVDVAIHCGDLTEESKLSEFRTALATLKSLPAKLKLVIPGNHDFTMDIPTFKKKLEAIDLLDDELVKREYGDFGEAQAPFESEEARAAGIKFLEEGTHRFVLENGAKLTVYASPYTTSLSDWGFTYHPDQGHMWDIDSDVDVVITHGPPRGVLDYTDSRIRAGSASLFAGIAKAKPLMHCFGHIHEGWGAKRVAWREDVGEEVSHFTALDNERSSTIATLGSLWPGKYDDAAVAEEKDERRKEYDRKGYVDVGEQIERGRQTLFVNAAIEGKNEESRQLPWVVDLELPSA